MRLARDFKKIALQALTKSYWVALIVALVAGALGSMFLTGPMTGSFFSVVLGREIVTNSSLNTVTAIPTIVILIFFLVATSIIAVIQFLAGGAAEIGVCSYNLKMMDNPEEAQFSTMFKGFDVFGKALGLRCWQLLLILLWTLLLVFPGVIAAYRYSMAPFIMADNPEISIRDAVRQSKQMMHGNKWRLFCLHFSFAGWHLLSLLTFGIGYLFLNPYLNAASAAFYLEVSGQSYRIQKHES